MKLKHLFLPIIAFGVFANVSARAENILIVGDSLTCGPFGQHLLDNLSKQGNRVFLYCAVSSAAKNWVDGKAPAGQICQKMTTASPKPVACSRKGGSMPKLEDLLRVRPKHPKFTRVIVALGTNSLPGSADTNYHTIAQAIHDKGTECDWVAPPHLEPERPTGLYPAADVQKKEDHLDKFYTSLESKVGGGLCTFYDSRPVTADGTAGHSTIDRIHRNESAGKYWADQFAPVPAADVAPPSAAPAVQ